MSFTGLLVQSVTVVRFDNSLEDAYGNPLRVESGRQDVPARLWQVSTEERELGEATVVDRWRVILPAGTAIDAGDEITESGRRFLVDGSPERVHGRHTEHHVEAALRYVGSVA